MLQVRNLHYSIGDRDLIAAVDWNLQPEKRFVLVGPNGSGKTTLLRILTGEIEPHAGTITRPRNYTIGYLPQEEIVLGRGTVLENALAGIPEIQRLEHKIHNLHTALEVDKENEILLKKLGPLEQRYQDLGGYTIEGAAKKILSGLGFEENQFHADFTEMSGGWCMRVYIAQLLLLNPDLLLLDEPTNHLDIPSMEWLEQYLLGYKGSIVIVSHDRFFIDRLAHEIYELDRGELTRYRGNYHFFEKQKQEKLRLLWKRRDEQVLERERITRFINKYRSDKRRASQVQSRIKMLEKMETIEIPPAPRRLDFAIQVETPGYKDVLFVENMSFRYQKDWVLEKIDLHISRGDKIALVGVNGAGKTTLVRLIAGELKPQQGFLRLGKKVQVGLYAQHQIQALHPDNTVFDEVASTAATGLITKIRQALGIFQFGDHEIDRKIKVLSGGEKARVSLAKILLSPVNFLIMDEPTTHLDITAREALEEALGYYDGTLLLISHDRYFLDTLVNRVIELKDRSLDEYSGNYSYYLWKREQEPDSTEYQNEKDQPQNLEAPGRKKKEQKRQEAEARQEVSRERNRLKNVIARIEKDIEESESHFREIETKLADPETYQDRTDISRLNKDYAELKHRIGGLYESWESHRQKLEELLKQLKGT
ncbi:MAG: ATP-binding cassette domain-containing protein [Candidatus Aminicenantes bacterium]|nr:MAG: ATP-binding cassette domain-containing protein [Candidatus Aminicenantes bacterium]